MATITPRAPTFYGLTMFQSIAVAKGTSQTYSAGDLVTVDATNGTVDDYANDDANLGVAGDDFTEAEAPSGSPNNALTNVYRLGPWVTAELNMRAAGGAIAQTDIGVDYGLVIESGNIVVDESDTTNTRVKVLGVREGAIGDTGARVLVRFLDTAVF